jgi:hypothetical protein
MTAEVNGLLLIVDYAKQNYEVFCSSKVFNILHEIGRLREVTFREVGEGTNESIDLDKFDQYYHLFLWDEDAKKNRRSLPYGSRFRNLSQIRHRGFYLNELLDLSLNFMI